MEVIAAKKPLSVLAHARDINNNCKGCRPPIPPANACD